MAHQRPVAMFRLDDRRRFKVELGESMHDFIQGRNVGVESGQIDVPAVDAVPVGVESVRPAVLAISEEAKVLRPVSERRDGVDELVWPGDGIGCC